jgi:hypothetical protein
MELTSTEKGLIGIPKADATFCGKFVRKWGEERSFLELTLLGANRRSKSA